jgi:hypothetical protein
MTPTTPPPDGAVIVIPVLPPMSSELVAVIDPAPALVTRKIPTHSSAEADPTEIVVTFVVAAVDDNPLGALDVPLMVRAPVIVTVPPCTPSIVTPLPTVIEANVPAVTWTYPGDELLLMVKLP